MIANLLNFDFTDIIESPNFIHIDSALKSDSEDFDFITVLFKDAEEGDVFFTYRDTDIYISPGMKYFFTHYFPKSDMYFNEKGRLLCKRFELPLRGVE